MIFLTKRLVRLALATAAVSAFALPATPAAAELYCHDFSTFIVCTPI